MMRKYLLSFLIVVGLLCPLSVFAGKIKILPSKNPSQIPKFEKRIHPLESVFCHPRKFNSKKRNANKLLVLLIEFNDEELTEDNPETTGNGKFLQDPDDYPINIGSPPHDHAFFTLQLDALKYYYRAASFFYEDGLTSYGYDLDFDIYPQPDPEGEFTAYTLPQSMAYYNPPNASIDLMIARFEEYFQDAFITADLDPEIQFSNYEHFMFIHAGSDWQHDYIGDTPSDMPSFFIQIGDGKEVVVDNGEAIMDHACNVPEMITQDLISSQYIDADGNTVTSYENFGVINAVMAHEFGHSLGYVDLYNTSNFYPGVGYFDIMDSGGFGQAGIRIYDEDNNISEYYIEGALPALPGAWSRIIAWEEDFRERGILKDFSQFPLDQEIEIAPSEKLYEPYDNNSYFIKVPLNEDEYILIENRQIDPDGDGGAALHVSDDERVFLYPTTYNEDITDTTATYEYDYLLPGWFDMEGDAIGGGLLIWHIDDHIIYEEGNYENNTVNQDYYHRGVKIIEADNIMDIGNPYSYFWRGSDLEAFSKYRPELVVINGSFVFNGWDIPETGGEEPKATHNDSLSAVTSPALITNSGLPSFFSIYNISSYSIDLNQERTMTFKIGTLFFDNNDIIAQYDSILAISKPGNSGYFANEILEFITITPTETYFSYLINSEDNLQWYQFPYEINLPEPTLPIITTDLNADDAEDFLIVHDNELHIISNINFQYNYEVLTYPSKIVDSPLYLKDLQVLVVCTEDSLYLDDSSFDIPDARCSYSEEEIIVLAEDQIHLLNPIINEIAKSIDFPDLDQNYDPIIFSDNENSANQVFLQDSKGNIFRLSDQTLDQIFDSSPWGEGDYSQLALGNIFQDDNPYLIFGQGEKVFALSLDGSLVPGFPGSINNSEIKVESFPRIICINQENILVFKSRSSGYIAFDNTGKYRAEYSIFLNATDLNDYFFWDEVSNNLFFIYTDSSGNLFSSRIADISQDPLIWNGFRHNDYGIFYGDIQPVIEPNVKMTAFAYPNPSRKGEVRLRITNAKRSIKVKIFDIAGNLVYSKNVDNEYSKFQDIIWNSSKMSSGLYFGIVQSAGEQKKIPIAIEN